MKNVKYLLLIIISISLLNSCSKNDDETSCPETENVSMKINGEQKQFVVTGWGIDLDNDGSGYTLSLWIDNGVINPQQDSYSIVLKLPYKKRGNNIIEEFNYTRIQNATSFSGDFVQGELESKVSVNKNSCFSATFSGNLIIDGNQVIITDGVFNHTYDEPFD